MVHDCVCACVCFPAHVQPPTNAVSCCASTPGRVAVMGGCLEYCGAPFYAALTALKTVTLHTSRSHVCVATLDTTRPACLLSRARTFPTFSAPRRLAFPSRASRQNSLCTQSWKNGKAFDGYSHRPPFAHSYHRSAHMDTHPHPYMHQEWGPVDS